MAKIRKKPRGPFAGRSMAGAPDVLGAGLGALGEHMGDPRRYGVEPGTDELVQEFEQGKPGMAQQLRHQPPQALSRQMAMDILEVFKEKGMPIIRTLPSTPDRIDVTQRFVGLAADRVDTGLKDRTDILLANMSQQPIWVSTYAVAAAGLGYPLAPMTAAAAYDGGTLSLSCKETVKWYAIAPVGVANLLLVIELAR